VCFAKHTLSKHNLGRLGLKPRLGPLFLSFLGLGPAQPIWAGLDLTCQAWSLAQASDPAGKQARVNQLTRVLHSAKVINYLRTILQHLHLKQRRMVLPSEDEGEDEGIGPSVGRRIFSSSSSFQSLPLCSCVSVCWVSFFFTYSLLSSAFLFYSFSLLSLFLFSAPFSRP